MNDIRVYSIWTYEKQILHDYYCKIVTHEVCDVGTRTYKIDPSFLKYSLIIQAKFFVY
jgi:hypothetical protein